MGAVLLRLEKGGIREPHWHPNAAELSLCVSGTAKMTIYSTNARVDTFTISPGQITFVPRAYWHDLENIGEEKVKFVIVYDNERPGDLGVSGSVGSLSARVFDRMFGINPPGFFNQLNYTSIQDVAMGSKPVDFSSTARSRFQMPTNLIWVVSLPKFRLQEELVRWEWPTIFQYLLDWPVFYWS